MKLTVSQLRKIIKEEVARTLREEKDVWSIRGSAKNLKDLEGKLEKQQPGVCSVELDKDDEMKGKLVVHGKDGIEAAKKLVGAKANLY
jgi:DNA-binding NarL/FixJ family response regulator